MVFCQIVIHHAHFLRRTAGEIGDEKRDEILFFPCFPACFIKEFAEPGKLIGFPLSHQTEYPRRKVFGRDFHMSGDVFENDLFGELRLHESQVQTDPGIDEKILHIRKPGDLFQQRKQWLFIGIVIGAGGGEHATASTAFFAEFRILRLVSVNVPGCSADIRHRAAEKFLFVQPFDAAQDRGFGTGQHMFALMKYQSAERTPAGTSPYSRDRVLDGFERGDLFLVNEVGTSGIRQFANGIEFFRGQRRLGRFHHDHAITRHLDLTASAPGIHFFFDGDGLTHDGIFIGTEFFVGREYHIIFPGNECLGLFAAGKPCGPPDPDEISAVPEPFEDLFDGTFAHAVGKDIRLGVHQNGRAHFILPVIVMRQPAHGRTDSAQDRGDTRKRGFTHLHINGFRMGRSVPRFPTGRIHIFVTETASCGIDTDHGIHISAGDSACDLRTSEFFQRIGIFPVRLRDHCHTEPHTFQISADDSRTE